MKAEVLLNPRGNLFLMIENVGTWSMADVEEYRANIQYCRDNKDIARILNAAYIMMQNNETGIVKLKERT